MDHTPFFSIVLPTYNRAHLIMHAIESVFHQTFSNWELIVVDDGSTDNTKDLILSKSDNRIRYIYQENAERSAARNNGIENAKGLYVCFLDSDDYYLPEHLQSLFIAIKEKNNPVAFFVTDVVRNEGGEKIVIPHEDVSGYPNGACFILQARESIIPSRVAIHRNILKEFKFDTTLKDVEDTVLWVEISVRYPIYFTSKATAVYSIHSYNSTNLSNNPFSNQLKGLKKLFSHPDISKLIPTRVKREKLGLCYLGIAKFFSLKKNYFAMVGFVIKSIVADPFSRINPAKVKMIIDIRPYL